MASSHAANQGPVAELHTRHIDRDLPARGVVGAPAADLRTRLPQHPIADFHDQAALLRDGDEFVGWHHAALRMRPAQQRLDRLDLEGLERETRLIVEREFLALERLAQICLERQPFCGARRDGFLEKFQPALVGSLGVMHRRVCIVHQRVGARGIERMNTDSNGCRERYLLPGDAERARQRELQPARHRLGSVHGGDAGKSQAEFVAADARNPILDGVLVGCVRRRPFAIAQTVLQSQGDLFQQRVARCRAVGIVDAREIVDVEHQHRHAAAAAPRPFDLLVEDLAQPLPVGQSGKRIVVSEVAHPRLARRATDPASAWRAPGI